VSTANGAAGRLVRLERVLARPPGCAHCRRWAGTVIRDEAGGASRPEVCPACGRDVPATTVVELGGGVRVEDV
jgi:hypothetical protein